MTYLRQSILCYTSCFNLLEKMCVVVVILVIPHRHRLYLFCCLIVCHFSQVMEDRLWKLNNEPSFISIPFSVTFPIFLILLILIFSRLSNSISKYFVNKHTFTAITFIIYVVNIILFTQSPKSFYYLSSFLLCIEFFSITWRF